MARAQVGDPIGSDVTRIARRGNKKPRRAAIGDPIGSDVTGIARARERDAETKEPETAEIKTNSA